jgi:hypothetical protein
VDFAGVAHTRDEVRFIAAAVDVLAGHHHSMERIALLTAPGPIIGRTAARW